jgi:hypothetical protein
MEPVMSLALRVRDVLSQHVTLETEGIDRMYLNAYVPGLQFEGGVVGFFRRHLGYTFASSVLMDPISKRLIGAIEQFVRAEQIPMITFLKGQRKDDVAAEMRKHFDREEGVIFVGKAQEKANVFRTEKRRGADGSSYPWIVTSTAMVNHYYFYILDRDFGPLFIKFCSYFPYNAKVCLNGHEWLKQQLTKRGIEFESLDNGILSCVAPEKAQKLCERFGAAQIEAVFRKWLSRLPHPFTAADRKAGYRYDLSILQAEFSLTMVMDRPLTGRVFFEEVIRENLDLGRPDQVQLIFARRITRKTPGRFRTRVITEGVIPSLHVDYKSARIKEYYKEGRALRVETTINDSRAFAIGKRLHNLPKLRELGFAANRRLLDVQTISHDCAVGEDTWNQVVHPITVGDQRASALRFDDPRVQALFAALVLFVFQTDGFTSSKLRAPLAQLLGIDPATITRGRMTYDLRRLRLHGIVERVPRTHRYRLTAQGLRVAMFFSRTWARLLRPGLSLAVPLTGDDPLRRAFVQLEAQILRFAQLQKCAA